MGGAWEGHARCECTTAFRLSGPCTPPTLSHTSLRLACGKEADAPDPTLTSPTLSHTLSLLACK